MAADLTLISHQLRYNAIDSNTMYSPLKDSIIIFHSFKHLFQIVKKIFMMTLILQTFLLHPLNSGKRKWSLIGPIVP